MNYIEIDFSKVKGYNQMSEAAKKHFERVYKAHNSIVGDEYKEDWKPIKVKEHENFIEVHFKNGDWLHYYSNGTWVKEVI